MRKLTLLLALLCISVCVGAQVPQKISYQAVLRNSDGTVIVNEDVVVRIGLLKGSANGNVIYSEQHEVQTSAQGIISLAIGAGTQNVQGNFATIPWNMEIFIKIEIKRDGSSDFIAMEPNRVLSVPYSLRAEAARRAEIADVAAEAGSAKSLVQGSVMLQPETKTATESPIFVVRNSAGQIVFAVYNDGLRSYVGNSPETGGFVVESQNQNGTGYFIVTPDSTRVYVNGSTKGPRSGFAVGGRAGLKTPAQSYFNVTPALTEIYFDSTLAKGPRSGFAVGGRAGQKGETTSFMSVTPYLTEFNFDESAIKGPRSGFAVGGRAGQKGEINDYLSITPLMTNIYVDEGAGKGPRSGFAVGGRAGQKGTGDLLYMNSDSSRIYFDDQTRGPRSGFAVGGRAGRSTSNLNLNISATHSEIMSFVGPDINNVQGMGGFDIGGVSSESPVYTSFFSVTPQIITITPNVVTTGTVEVQGDVVTDYSITDVQDAEGNWYKTVEIGGNRWFKSNLRTTKYADETPISPNDFTQTDSMSINVMGRYYSWQTINKNNVCPEGWHVSSLADWEHLRNYVLAQGFSEDEIINAIAMQGYWDNNENVSPVDTFGFSMPGAGSYVAGSVVGMQESATYWLGDFGESNIITLGNTIDLGYNQREYNTIRCVEGHLPLNVRAEYYDSLQSSSVVLYGDILHDGGSVITERGFCYSTDENPTVNGNKVISLDTTDLFSAKLTNLEAFTLYVVRAYAINATDTAYSKSIEIRTMPDSPQAIIDSISNIGINNAHIHSTIIGVELSDFGICISDTLITTTNMGRIIPIGEYFAEGEYITEIDDLVPNTLYYVCAYTRSEVGITLSKESNFKTFSLPILRGIQVDSITGTSMIVTDSLISDGGKPVTEYGVRLWRQMYGKANAMEIASTDSVNLYIKVDSLKSNAEYMVQTYATNEFGTTTSEVTITTLRFPDLEIEEVDSTFSSTSVLIRGWVAYPQDEADYNHPEIYEFGYCYDTSATPSISGQHKPIYAADGGGIISDTIVGLTPETLYYINLYAKTEAGITYSETMHFTTIPETTVTLDSIVGIDTSRALIYTTVRGYNVREGGVCYGFVDDLTLNTPNVSVQYGKVSEEGVMESWLYDLTPNTQYYVRSFAIRGADSVYSAVDSFKTFSKPILKGIQVDSITGTSMIVTDSLISDGGKPVTEYGVRFWRQSYVTASDTIKIASTDSVNLSIKVDSLESNAEYMVQTYATNEFGTTTSEVTITTLRFPDLEIEEVDSTFSSTSVLIRGWVAYPQDEADYSHPEIYEFGYCYDTSATPSISGQHKPIYAADGGGIISDTIVGLTPETLYYINLYAKTEAGITYSETMHFTTIPETTVTLDSIVGIDTSRALIYTTVRGYNVREGGVCYGFVDDLTLNTPNVSVQYGKVSEEGVMESWLYDLTPNTQYYVRSFAIRGADSVYSAVDSFKTFSRPILRGLQVDSLTGTSVILTDSIVSDGGKEITEMGFKLLFYNEFYQESDSMLVPCTSTNNLFSAKVENLDDGTLYEVYPYAKNYFGYNERQQTSVGTYSYPYMEDKLSVITISETEIFVNGCQILAGHEYNVTEFGYCYGTEPNPTINGTHTVSHDTSASPPLNSILFSDTIRGLNPATTYYIRAYVKCKAGVAYGNNVVGKTGSLPVLSNLRVEKNVSEYQASIYCNIESAMEVDSCGIILLGTNDTMYQIMPCDHWMIDESAYTFSLQLSYGEINSSIRYKAYAANSIGITYSEVDSIVLSTDISVKTIDATNVSYTKADLVGYLDYDIEQVPVGFYYGLNRNNLSDSLLCRLNNNEFQQTINYLFVDTTYFFVAFAGDGIDRVYGDTLSFRTLRQGSVTDIDGNTYKTIIYENTEWLAENLKTTRYNDGTSIAFIEDDATWSTDSLGAYCYAVGNAEFADSLGLLYNWYAVDSKRLCPDGWIVPMNEQWYSMQNIEVQYLKEYGMWPSGYNNGTNDYLFSARQVTRRESDGAYGTVDTPQSAYWWSSELSWNANNTYSFMIRDEAYGSVYELESKNYGLSVRCIRSDEPIFKVSASEITQTTAKISGFVLTNNPMTSMGIIIAGNEIYYAPSLEHYSVKYELKPSAGNFEFTIPRLPKAQSVDVVVYSEIEGKVYYSEPITVQTLTPETIISYESVSNITDTSALVNWNCFTYEEFNVRAGICYDTVPFYDFSSASYVEEYPYGLVTRTETIVSQELTSLLRGTTYYVRAYFINDVDTLITDMSIFTTTNTSGIANVDENVYKSAINANVNLLAINYLFKNSQVNKVAGKWALTSTATFGGYNSDITSYIMCDYNNANTAVNSRVFPSNCAKTVDFNNQTNPKGVEANNRNVCILNVLGEELYNLS